VNTPYNNGKVQIGKYYQPPKYIEQDRDMILIQSYLIQDPKLLRRQYWLNKAYWVALGFLVFSVWLYN
jgi:putative ubiquitin-RnfH superfamily antitoxin RatB of RatAB toxin-antitoxin module